MTTSSAQDVCSITFVDNQDTISFPAWDSMASASDTITITNGGSSYFIGAAGASASTYSISGAGATVGGITNIGAIGTISSINTSAFTFNSSEEWINCFPDFDRIEKMCKEYPGLAIAFEKFKTTYKLVKDHYDTPEDKRPKP
jgi:hypothetical protein